ncbi:MAG: ribonuclease HII [Prevotella sp.]|nr:ribonuclease HII [Prevotella sp.]MCI6447891.1 ribonuclease HII [Prevotella sp.]MDY4538427.1 ribonuclease HII [Prevotella sp.]MDY4751488.1 ribonuclease HII [Prevotella sp.]MDY5680827.1 ribonuclease HII [Prevotella sp.]
MLQNKYYESKIEAGCDEAGRGCLAGPVFAAAVILPDDYVNETLNDSKQLSEKKRYLLREQIERDALAWAVGVVTAQEIDHINILNASILAMHRALDRLSLRPEAVIVDGNKFKPYIPFATLSPEERAAAISQSVTATVSATSPADMISSPLPSTTIVKGDGKYLSIAAASILAKTYRDDFMKQIDEEYPAYQWKKNKGYPTKAHYAAIREHGPSPYHRLTFAGVVDRQLTIDFGKE